MPLEIELKLAIAPEDVPRLARVPQLKAATRGRVTTSRVYSIYYDTPEFALRGEGAAVRLRRVGARWIQTLKSGGRVEAGLHQRDELETPVPAQMLNYPVLASAGASPVLADPDLPLKLQPMFVTDFRRTVRQIEPSSGSRIELCLDRGTISAGAVQAPIDEIELELKSGPPEELLKFALTLLERVPLRLEPASKAQRGYALVDGSRSHPVKAGPPELERQMDVTQAFRCVVFSCIAHLQANERGLLESDDPEYLHQARVALRRLRSAFSVFGAAFPRALFAEQIAELRWLGSLLGPARDWDVFVTQTLPALHAVFPGETGLDWLAGRSAELRAFADQRAREAVASTRYTALLLKLIGVFLSEPWKLLADEEAAAQRALPLTEFATGVLARRQNKTLKRGRGLKTLDFACLHALRIQIKKLRYATEFFSSLYDKKAVKGYAGGLARLQELLGGLNDCATVERLMQPLAAAADTAAAREGVGLVRGWAAANARAHLAALPRKWKRFRDCEVFWE
jgi:triphosphatase